MPDDDAGEHSSPSPRSRTREEDGGDGGRPCPHCEEPMYERHCKYVCPQHGVVYDCSDTFY